MVFIRKFLHIKTLLLEYCCEERNKYIVNASYTGSSNIEMFQLSKIFKVGDEPATFPRPSSYKFVIVVWGQSSKYDLNVAVSNPSVKKVMWVLDDLPWEATVSCNVARRVSQCPTEQS